MIPVQNLYHMLSYAFRILREQGYRSLATEPFENAADLCAAILIRGVSSLMRQGLPRDYRPRTEMTATPRGKIEIADSIRTRSMMRRQLVCTYDEFTCDTDVLRVVKATMRALMRARVRATRRRELRRLLLGLAEVETVDLRMVRWSGLTRRNRRVDQMLLSICWLVAKGLLQTQRDGTVLLMDFFDEQRMSSLYERFILEYYRQEFPRLHVAASQVPWLIDDDERDLLPAMRTDATLTLGNRVLIVDAKYYAHATQRHHNVRKLHSAHLYQIFAYVKNKDAAYGDRPHEVSGMLLYAATDEEPPLNQTYMMSGNRIGARTLHLDAPFSEIARQLDGIVKEHFSLSKSPIPSASP